MIRIPSRLFRLAPLLFTLVASSHASTNRSSHWAFQPVGDVAIPRLRPNQSPDHNPIDAFIVSQLQPSGLSASPPADRLTLIRRLLLDMHGLPPTPEQVTAFLASQEPDAYSRLVDQVLASPRYGERWAQHWLDVVRYADTHGYEVNTPRPNAWPYRDYVIASLNSDKPYDQFVFEQLAGDSVGEDAATGFLVAAAVLLPGQIGQDDASQRQARQDALNEIIVGTCETFLGLSVGCARCHDHKFDPIPQRDYYAMQAFFAGVEYGDRPINDQAALQRKQLIEQLDAKIALLKEQLAETAPLLRLRPMVNPERNLERFPARKARFVRFTTFQTQNLDQYEPCIDELEVFEAGTDRNAALASAGTKAASSGDYPDSQRHKLEHINDGRYGNERSWISNTRGGGWIQLEFPQAVLIDRVVWGRDREGKFKDRLPIRYRIELALQPDRWEPVAGSDDREPYPLDGNPGQPSAHSDIDSLLKNLPANATPSVRALATQLENYDKKRKSLGEEQLVFAGTYRNPDIAHLLRRGDPEQPLDPVAPQVPDVCGSLALEPDAPEQARRIALGRWIGSAQNPLTARVMANRVWQYHFGNGLVDTPSDFGLNGSKPSHPELLDWLARELIQNRWSLKHLHRLILLSHTYRQSNHIDPQAQALDASCRLLWGFPSRRLEAEPIRDSILQISNRLNLRMGGPGFNFFTSRGGLNGFPPVETFGPEELRRMIYSHKVRMERVPVFGAFDCPDAGQAMPRRRQSTTAIQALNLFNSPFLADQAEVFANRIASEIDAPLETGIRRAFLLALGRAPTELETEEAGAVVREHGLPTLCRVLFNSNEFLFLP